MARKIVGFYCEDSVTTDKQLVVEIGRHQFACMIKNTETDEVEAFELFQLDETPQEWNDVFYEIRQYSTILQQFCSSIRLFYNFEEAMLMPGEQKNIVAAEDHLSLLYGESEWHELKYDKIGAKDQFLNAYRIQRNIHELAGRYFPSHEVHHVYAPLLEDVLSGHWQDSKFMKLQFYSHHLVLVLINDQQLQLVQSFEYQTAEDILYYLLNTAQQFALPPSSIPVEVSGFFDRDGELHQRLVQLFQTVHLDEMVAGDILQKIADAGYPSHYFTPFFKLADYEDHIR
ncbi:DUF3822 family protein [Asinibacterium sp. OR53]|uniref:DUF3822 family protein n=1 Tax=Asinibacterium sp. OR53 TaxID=925409 RepID=UPI00047D4DF4|nr:DUF3822 family protein [Asinibacterium sp. OR53]